MHLYLKGITPYRGIPFCFFGESIQRLSKLSPKRCLALNIYDPSKTQSYTYNSDGSLSTTVDKKGNTTTNNYDIHGRLEKQVTTDAAISYTYDKNSNQLTMNDNTGTTTSTYDEQDRVKTKQVPRFGTITHLYDILLTGDEAGYVKEVMTDVKGNITSKLQIPWTYHRRSF